MLSGHIASDNSSPASCFRHKGTQYGQVLNTVMLLLEKSGPFLPRYAAAITCLCHDLPHAGGLQVPKTGSFCSERTALSRPGTAYGCRRRPRSSRNRPATGLAPLQPESPMATGIAPATGIVHGGRGIANDRHSKARYLLIMVRGRCCVHTHYARDVP